MKTHPESSARKVMQATCANVGDPKPATRNLTPETRVAATRPGTEHPASHLYICTNCRQEEWIKHLQSEKRPDHACRHCGHELEERFPERADLTAEDRGLLLWLSEDLGRPTSDVLSAGLLTLARQVAKDKAGRNHKIPQWLADRLQKKP